jgi:hypothetical protein
MAYTIKQEPYVYVITCLGTIISPRDHFWLHINRTLLYKQMYPIISIFGGSIKDNDNKK